MMMVMVTNTTSDRGAFDPQSDKAIRTGIDDDDDDD
jgi:hypothetical protein